MMLARGWRQPPSSDATCQRMEAEGGEEAADAEFFRGADVGEGPAGGIDFVEGAGGAALGDGGDHAFFIEIDGGSGGKS